jgi:hypothetical protein
MVDGCSNMACLRRQPVRNPAHTVARIVGSQRSRRVESADTVDETDGKLMDDIVEPRREFLRESALEAEMDA